MGVQVAAVTSPCASSSASSSSAIATSSRSLFLGIGCIRLMRAQSSVNWSIGLMGRRRGQQPLRRALSASLDSIRNDGGDDEEFLKRIEEPALGLQAGGCGWPASVERSASSVELPLSLRMLKRKKQQQQQRWDERLLDSAGESARASVRRAFSSMVFIIREMQSFTLQMRQALFYEDLQGILARVHGEMHASFVWLFQHIFACTPTLMVSVMLLLANFTVYSMGHNVAAVATIPPPQPPAAAAATIIETQQNEPTQPRFDPATVKTFSIGRTASVGGNSGGGGKVRPVAGATGDDRSDESSCWQGRTVLPPPTPVVTSTEEGGVPDTMAEEAEDEVAIWSRIVAEASRMQAGVRDESLMDPDIVMQLVAPVKAELETEDYAEYLRTEQRYEQAVTEQPNNSLLLANFAQFLYLVQHDHDRAEHYFRRAVRAEPADAEALSWYATFLWKARNDLGAAEETFQEAIAADPSNAHHAATYAHFLWNTGGEDTCYPLE